MTTGAGPTGRGPLVLAAGSVLDASAEAVLSAASAAGFDAVGLRVTDQHRPSDHSTIARAASDLGVFVHDAEVVRIGDRVTPPQRVVEAAVAVGARSVLAVSDLASPSATTEQLARLVEDCRRAGLTVGLEYMAWTTPTAPDAAIEMARATGCLVVVDVLHHTRVGAGTEALHRIVEAGVLGWVQLCDAPARFDGDLVDEARHRRLAPGAGELPLRELLDVVPDDTPVSVEVQSDVLAAVPPDERARLLAEAARCVLGRSGHGPSSTG